MPITIHAPTATLWTEQRGCGEDVLLLPGLGEDAFSWGALADQLASTHRVTLVDTRGTGRSPAPERPWRIKHFVDDALAVLDGYGIASAHVVGSCLGAVTAQELAAAHPDRVQSLTLNGTWRASDPHFAALLSSWIWTAQHAQTLRELAQVVALSTSTPQHWRRGTVDAELEGTSRVRGNDLLLYRRGFTSAARMLRSYDAGARLRAIEAPTLLTVGEEDAMRPVSHTYEVAAEIPGSRVEVIRGAGRRVVPRRAGRLRRAARLVPEHGGADDGVRPGRLTDVFRRRGLRADRSLVRVGASPALADPADVRFRAATVTTGCVLSIAMGVAGLVYYGLTWDLGHRLALTVLTVAIIVSGVVVTLLPMRQVIAGRWRETFFFSWTAATVIGILTMTVVDPARPSPLSLPLFMPLLFAGMSYPRDLAMVIAVAVPVSYVTTAVVIEEDLAYAMLFTLSLAGASVMCMWQVHNRERQRAELDRQRDELARASRADPLTGALNRRGFEERLEAELSVSARSGRPFTLAMIDLDHFKAVNDQSGHSAGDEVLRRTAAYLVETLRPSDAVGRIGGDEFALLLPGLADADADKLLERVREGLRPVSPACFGHASFPVAGASADELFRHADEILYAAKGHRPRTALGPVDLSWAATLANAVDRRMDVAHDHSRAVADLAAEIAQRMGWDPVEVGRLRLAATLHDVGKVAVPDHILRKPGRLDDAEYEAIKEHSTIGAEMVSRITGMEPVVPWIRHSHEHVDGSGYPDALAGDSIPIASRILLVADAFDAMTSDRSYRRAMSTEAALAELRRNAGAQFEPLCVDILEQIVAPSAHEGAHHPQEEVRET